MRAGLTEQGLLGVGQRIGVFDRHAQCIQRLQRIAQVFDLVLGTQQGKFKHGGTFFFNLRAKTTCQQPFGVASMESLPRSS